MLKTHPLSVRALRALYAGVTALVCVISLARCSHAQPPTGHPAQMQARVMLLAELRSRVPPTWGRIDTATVRFWDDSSSVPGVTYHWALYRPPRTMHVVFTAIVGQREGIPLPIRSTDDWRRVTGPFVPARRQEVLQACLEAIHVTAEPRHPRSIPGVYNGPESLRHTDLLEVTKLQVIQHAHPPEVNRIDHENWVAHFWAVEASRVREYTCVLGRDMFSVSGGESFPAGG